MSLFTFNESQEKIHLQRSIKWARLFKTLYYIALAPTSSIHLQFWHKNPFFKKHHILFLQGMIFQFMIFDEK